MRVRSTVPLRLSTFLACCLLPVSAQTGASTSAATLLKARALYYTPVDAGLRGFHCDVSFDWKQFIQKATNQPVPDDDVRLKYLRSIALTVDDDLRGTGELHWTAPAPPPENQEDAIGKVRGGMQQIWAGFAQSWNGYFNGELVSLDAKAIVEHSADGYHVAVRNGAQLAEEQYDDKLLLQTVHVSTPTQETTMSPIFLPSAQRLLVTSMRSVVRQPLSAQPIEVLMTLQYAPVATFQIPSELNVSVGTANFDFHLLNCTVQTQLTSK